MNLDPAAVERIVQEVVQRLVAAGHSVRESAPTPGEAAAPEDRRGVLRPSERVLSWKGLEDRLVGVKTIEVGPRAVVTPLVRDLLKERRIAIVVVDPKSPRNDAAARSTDVPSLWVGCDRETLEARPYHVRSLVGNVSKEFGAEKTLLDQDFASLTRTFAAKGQGRTLRLWFSDRLALAVCEANRQSHIRATWANDPEEASRNVAALRPNVLVLPPSRFTPWQVRQVVAAWTIPTLPA